MNDEIQFGELETSEPRRARRPDEDRRYVVAQIGQLSAGDLPIFIDLDVHAELEVHAATDTSVELGGVLLGRACHDSDGKRFVVVNDCIRAQHYESTKGSFKFTHETWAAIGRERERNARGEITSAASASGCGLVGRGRVANGGRSAHDGLDRVNDPRQRPPIRIGS